MLLMPQPSRYAATMLVAATACPTLDMRVSRYFAGCFAAAAEHAAITNNSNTHRLLFAFFFFCFAYRHIRCAAASYALIFFELIELPTQFCPPDTSEIVLMIRQRLYIQTEYFPSRFVALYIFAHAAADAA